MTEKYIITPKGSLIVKKGFIFDADNFDIKVTIGTDSFKDMGGNLRYNMALIINRKKINYISGYDMSIYPSVNDEYSIVGLSFYDRSNTENCGFIKLMAAIEHVIHIESMKLFKQDKISKPFYSSFDDQSPDFIEAKKEAKGKEKKIFYGLSTNLFLVDKTYINLAIVKYEGKKKTILTSDETLSAKDVTRYEMVVEKLRENCKKNKNDKASAASLKIFEKIYGMTIEELKNSDLSNYGQVLTLSTFVDIMKRHKAKAFSFNFGQLYDSHKKPNTLGLKYNLSLLEVEETEDIADVLEDELSRYASDSDSEDDSVETSLANKFGKSNIKNEPEEDESTGANLDIDLE